MAKVRIAQSARADLVSIGSYTLEEWGDEQMRRYMTNLRRAIASLGQRPFSGRSRSDLSDDMRAWPTGSHVTYYTADAETVIILRVLHSRQDPGPALQSGA